MAGLAVGRAANDSFFIATAGASQIPYVFIINALLLGGSALLYSFFERYIARFRLFTLLLLFFLLALALLRHNFSTDTTWLPYAIFGYYELLLLIMQMHFWTCVNDIFDPHEGKRLFPYIGGIGLLGSISGGLTAGFAAPRVGLENLFFIWMALLGLAIPVALWAWKNCGDRIPKFHLRERFNFKQLQQYPLVSILVWISIPLWLVVHTVDWLFYLAIEEIFPDNPDQLSAFLGFLGGAVSFCGLIIQFLITGPLLRRKGVPFSFAVYAFSVTLGAFLLGVRSLLGVGAPLLFSIRSLFAVMVRFLDESVLLSIYDSAGQLLYGALPAAIRGQARALVSGMVEPTMTAIAGLILIFAASLQVDHSILAFSAIGVGLIWIYLSFRVRSYYLQALLSNLSSNDIDRRQLAKDQLAHLKLDANVHKYLLNSLLSEDSQVALLSLDYLQKSTHTNLKNIIPLLPRMQLPVLKKSLDILGSNRVKEAASAVKKLTEHSQAEVCAAALRSLALILPDENRELYEKYLNSDWESVRAAAIISILDYQKKLNTRNPAYRALRKMVQSSSTTQNIYAAHIISSLKSTKEKYPINLLMELLRKKNHNVTLEATRALGYIEKKQSVSSLLKLLDDPILMYSAISALVKLGSYAIPQLHEELINLQKAASFNRSQELRKRNLLRSLSRIAHPSSALFLRQFLDDPSEEVEDTALNALVEIKQSIASNKNFDKGSFYEFDKGNFHKNSENKNSENKNGENGSSKAASTGQAISPNKETLLPLEVITFAQSRFQETIQRLNQEYLILTNLRLMEDQKALLLLIDALQNSVKKLEQRTAKYLEIIFDKQEIHAAMSAIRGGASRQRSEAIEAMEGYGMESSEITIALEHFLKKPQTEKSGAPSSPQATMSIEESLSMVLEKKRSFWIIACSLFAISTLQLKSLVKLVLPFKKSDNPLVRYNASNTLVKLGYYKHLSEVYDMNVDMEKVLFLRTVPLFSDVDGHDLQWISEIAVEKSYRRGVVIFQEGDRGDDLYVVMDGSVRIFKGPITVDILEERECFGEMAIIDGVPRSAGAEAERDVKLLAIHRNDFERLIMNQPRIAIALFRNASRRLREALGKLSL